MFELFAKPRNEPYKWELAANPLPRIVSDTGAVGTYYSLASDELSTNLVSNDWTTHGIELVGSAGFSNVWETVTNRTDIGERAFIRLKIEEE